MQGYTFLLLFLQYFAETRQSNTTVSANTTKLTWREILPNNCGYRDNEGDQSVEELPSERRSDDGEGYKIKNGHFSTIDAHPWQVAIIQRDDKILKCGGTIISKYHVLTAAHCFVIQTQEKINGVIYNSSSPVSYRSRLVAVGSTRFIESNLLYNYSEVYIHDFYSLSHRRNDIALLKIDGEFVWSSRVKPICLPAEDQKYTPELPCLISGFGNLDTGRTNYWGMIRYGSVALSTDNACKRQRSKKFSKITKGMFCASGYWGPGVYVDTCQADSGGPLHCKGENESQRVLFGITSFGHGCGLENYPGVYTKVSKYLQWIYNRMEVSLNNGHVKMEDLPEDVDIGRPTSILPNV